MPAALLKADFEPVAGSPVTGFFIYLNKYRERTMFTLNAEVRSTYGKGASRRLRHAGQFPAIVYGGKEEAVAIVLDHDLVMNMQAKEGFYNETITLVIDGKPTNVKVQAVQRHPFKPKLAHLDFVRV